MNEQTFFNALIIGWFVLAVIVFVSLFRRPAPYGRHIGAGRGPTVSTRLGWLIMEAPAVLTIAVFFVLGTHRDTLAAWVLLGIWEAHYLYRAFVYPWTLRGQDKRMPIFIPAMGAFFNVITGYLNGRFLFTLSGGYPNSWLLSGQFLAGLLLFVAGYAINRTADRTLRGLRRPAETGYLIPEGGLYRWVTCPNYLGEVIQWIGWAVLTWSLPGLAFAVWTMANLLPRASAHHAWYRAHFADYPAERRALLPGLW